MADTTRCIPPSGNPIGAWNPLDEAGDKYRMGATDKRHLAVLFFAKKV